MLRLSNLRSRWPVSATGGDAHLLTMAVSAEPSSALVVLAGEADLTVSGRLVETLTALVLTSPRNLVIDLPGADRLIPGPVPYRGGAGLDLTGLAGAR